MGHGRHRNLFRRCLYLPTRGRCIDKLSLYLRLLMCWVLWLMTRLSLGRVFTTTAKTWFAAEEAAIRGATSVKDPLFLPYTTVVVFAPWAFLTGPQSEFLRHLSAVIAFALAFSLIEAFFILPAHFASFLSARGHTRASRCRKIADGITSFAANTHAPLERAPRSATP